MVLFLSLTSVNETSVCVVGENGIFLTDGVQKQRCTPYTVNKSECMGGELFCCHKLEPLFIIIRRKG